MTYGELKRILWGINPGMFGDPTEKEYKQFIKSKIPKYSEFWRIFVFPYRNPKSIWLNIDLPKNHEAVCIYNYSIFRSTLRVQLLSNNAQITYQMKGEIASEQFDDWLIWLIACYDKVCRLGGAFADTFIEKSDKALEDIGQWKSKWSLLKDNKELIKIYNCNRDKMDRLRAYVIHAAKFPGYNNKIPKQSRLKELCYWSDFRKYIRKDENDSSGFLIDRYLLLEQETNAYYDFINYFWQSLIQSQGDDENIINENFINRDLLECKENIGYLFGILNNPDPTIMGSAVYLPEESEEELLNRLNNQKTICNDDIDW